MRLLPVLLAGALATGIGLALSRQIAEAHGGTVTLDNRVPGPGCRAELVLPLD